MTTEIGSKYGPFDIAMIPIWRGGTLSFIARLGFRVRFSHLPSHQTNVQPKHKYNPATADTRSRFISCLVARVAVAGSTDARRAARSPFARDAFCYICG